MLELQERKRDYWFIHTGQHSLKGACEEFGLKKPDFVLSKAPNKADTKFWSKINSISIIWFLVTIPKIKKIMRKIKPSHVIYHGDTMTTLAASIASSKLLNPIKKWENVHLEAGLRSGGLFEPFPEEISRIISDKFSDILFAVSKSSVKNLKEYKENKKIILTGNTIVDSALISYNNTKKKFKKEKGEYVLINIHRHDNLRDKKRMGKIIDILNKTKIKAIWPLHDNTAHHLKKYDLMRKIENMKNIKITPIVNYFEFIFLIANCKYLITDGGSIQEESLVFKKPCIILRKKTERQEGLSTGINFLTKLKINYSKKVIELIENNKLETKNFKNPYGEKGLSKKIVDLLK
tara:strand:- start:100 stop:1146 length:1047 start_codon:yes stop_codon:yes gene_type:complete